MRSALFAISALLILAPAAALAQSAGSLTDTNPFSISVSPDYPAPYGQATLSFVSSTLDLTNATLTVSVGGKQIYKGNVQPVTVTLGKAGGAIAIAATIISGGSSYYQSAVIQPEDVSLIAEPLSSAPVLYPGKPLIPLEGSTRVVAVASFKDAAGRSIDPATLSYAWTVDDTKLADSSGIGKSTIIVPSPLQYRTRNVSVVIKNQAGSLVGGGSLALTPATPTVRIYERDPLLGIRFDQALAGSYAIAGSEDTLYAAPFSLPTSQGAPAISWFLNGTAAQTGSLITLRPSGSGQGSATLSLTASTGGSAGALMTLPLTFGTPASSNFFGL